MSHSTSSEAGVRSPKRICILNSEFECFARTLANKTENVIIKFLKLRRIFRLGKLRKNCPCNCKQLGTGIGGTDTAIFQILSEIIIFSIDTEFILQDGKVTKQEN